VTGVASFILLTNVGDQNLRALHLDFEGRDQRVFCVNDNVFRFPVNFKAPVVSDTGYAGTNAEPSQCERAKAVQQQPNSFGAGK
jgi:hypothetical protein